MRYVCYVYGRGVHLPAVIAPPLLRTLVLEASSPDEAGILAFERHEDARKTARGCAVEALPAFSVTIVPEHRAPCEEHCGHAACRKACCWCGTPRSQEWMIARNCEGRYREWGAA